MALFLCPYHLTVASPIAMTHHGRSVSLPISPYSLSAYLCLSLSLWLSATAPPICLYLSVSVYLRISLGRFGMNNLLTPAKGENPRSAFCYMAANA